MAWNNILDKIKEKFNKWGSLWLNHAGRVVLIKSVLSALPIFQLSMLLAPGKFKSEISQEIRRFLWQGGRSNSRRHHLINWNTVKAPKSRGGLGIRDPFLLNLALGTKILWRMVTRQNEWWKKDILHKYFTESRLRCLDHPPLEKSGSQIWNLLKASLPLIQNNLSWSPGNGKNIKLATDRIHGSAPLEHEASLLLILSWLSNQGKHSLYDISTWNRTTGKWLSWDLGNPPTNIQPISHLLISRLKGCAPISLNTKDSHCWNAQHYSVKQGFISLLNDTQLPPKASHWKNIWNNDGLPKINTFCWTLLHRKILTGENLSKRGIHGPFRCALCKKESDTIQHIFLECSYVHRVWEIILQNLYNKVRWPNTINHLLQNWKSRYKGSLKNKATFQRIWTTLPKYVSWKIWLARNKALFVGDLNLPASTANRVVSLLSEHLSQNNLPSSSLQNMDNSESTWVGSLNINFSDTSSATFRPAWQLQFNKMQLEKWLTNRKTHSLFF
jgi:hypothetical protein